MQSEVLEGVVDVLEITRARGPVRRRALHVARRAPIFAPVFRFPRMNRQRLHRRRPLRVGRRYCSMIRSLRHFARLTVAAGAGADADADADKVAHGGLGRGGEVSCRPPEKDR
jgi:hypothetical protein